MADSNSKLITFLKRNKKRVLEGTISEKEAVEASGIDPGKIGPAMWAAEPVAVPECKIKATKSEIVKARKNRVRWERIAQRADISISEAKEIGGKEAAEVYVGRGTKGGNGDGPAKASSGRRSKAAEKQGTSTSGRRQASGKSGNGRRTPRARTRAELKAKAGNPK